MKSFDYYDKLKTKLNPDFAMMERKVNIKYKIKLYSFISANIITFLKYRLMFTNFIYFMMDKDSS